LRSAKNESLYVNSFFLVVSNLVTAGLGFVFWLLAARLYTAEEIGLASSLISAMGLISYLALLGFNSTFIKYLPKSKQRNENINTGLLLVFGAALLIAAGYILLLPLIAPKLHFLHDSLAYSAGFIVMTAVAAANFLTDSVYIAFRGAKYNLYVYALMGVLKLGLVFGMAGLGAYGLYAATGAAGLAGLGLSLVLMAKLYGFRIQPTVHVPILKQVFRFSFGNYVANLLNILPTLIIPLIILAQLGAESAGYYYVTFMVANLIYAVSYAVAQSLFAEGSYADKPFHLHIKRATLVLSAVIIPATAFLALAGKWLLLIFGKEYSTGASDALIILSLAAPFVAIYAVSMTLLRVIHKTAVLVVLNTIYVILIAGLSFLWTDSGLKGIAMAWLVGHAVTGILGSLLFMRLNRRAGAARTLPESA
jgi:O-antigen/teichoic acid export membrane protein